MEQVSNSGGKQEQSASWPLVDSRFRRSSGTERRFHRAARLLVNGAFVALIVVGVLGGLSWIRSQPAVRVVQSQLQAIHQGELVKAYGFFSNEYKEETSLPVFRRWVRRQQRLTRIDGVQFWSRSVWGGVALLRGSFQDGFGRRYPVRYLLIRQDGEWRVHQFQLAPDIPRVDTEPDSLLRI
ncbi:MAG: hypothetical protein A3F68_04775 [Acidobacteria bacterium RIFCSPLOWO2_12_FULL_54_10]|nr:MAG: hypothetical protein A3F68_04775 [Acidobacteria bacterium RIFCSPLOWO2_12_FULL_54_10]